MRTAAKPNDDMNSLRADLLDLRRSMERFDDKLDKGNAGNQEIKSQLSDLNNRINVSSVELINRIERVEHKSEMALLQERIKTMELEKIDTAKDTEEAKGTAGTLKELSVKTALLWLLATGALVMIIKELISFAVSHSFGGK